MIRSSIPEIAQELVSHLPQKDNLNLKQVISYLNKMVDRGEDIRFITRRLGGIGGSEMTAILKHYYPIEFKDEHPFRDANQIYIDKLMLGASPRLDVAVRGQKIEPFIRDLFVSANNLDGCLDEHAMKSVRVHADNQYMLGNPDDIFIVNGTRVLPDYKSSCLDPNQESPKHYIQLNQYAENCRSHGFPVDVALTVNLHAPEVVLQDLIKAYENREADPTFYQFYKDGILNNKFSHIRFYSTPIKISPELGQLCSETITRFMNDHVIPGRPVNEKKVAAVFVGDELEKAEQINSQIFQLKQLENAVGTLLRANIITAKNLLDKKGLNMEWPTSDYPMDFRSSMEIDIESALEVADVLGVEKRDYTDVIDSLNSEKVKRYFQENNMELPPDLYDESVNKTRLIAALKDKGVPVEILYGEEKIQFSLSKKASNQDELMSGQIELQAEIVELCNSLSEKQKINLSQYP